MSLEGETITNEAGGKQSFLNTRFDCIPAIVLRLLAQCLGFGARKYTKDNWKKIPIEDNLAHAQNHINEWIIGDRAEPHLVNAMARLSFALWQACESGEQPKQYIHPDMLAKAETEPIKPKFCCVRECRMTYHAPSDVAAYYNK